MISHCSNRGYISNFTTSRESPLHYSLRETELDPVSFLETQLFKAKYFEIEKLESSVILQL